MATVIAFTSGKGGVGKTNIATNIGLSLVARNAKVCLFDTATGLASINIFMGFSPLYTIEHVLNGQKSIDEIIIKLPTGISIVPAASGIKQDIILDDKQISLLTSSLERLEEMFDYILIDTAAGIDSNVLDFVASSHFTIMVITSEPTSLTDSFALLKMLLIRGKKDSIYTLVNRVNGYQTSQKIFKRFQKSVKTYLKIDVHYLGYLATDESVNMAVSQQFPVVLSFPNSSVSCGLASLADIINGQFKNDTNLSFSSRYLKISTQKNITAIKPVAQVNMSDTLPTAVKDVFNEKDNKLFDVYNLLDQQQLSEQQLKELVLTLESIYEKKHKQSLRNFNSIIALILAEGDEENIQQLHTAIEQSFECQFKKKINNPSVTIQELMKNDQFSKNDFNCLMESFASIYKQRFHEKHFVEGDLLLTHIEQLLSNKK